MQPILLILKCAARKDICTAIKACPTKAIAYVDDEDEPLGGRITFDLINALDVGNAPKYAAAMPF